MNIKIEHIDRLSKGQKSWINIWSRAVPHHLYKFEQWKYERALKNKFLEITKKDRINLINIWDKVCLAKGWPNFMLVKDTETGTSEILRDGIPVTSWDTKNLKHLIRTYI